MKKILCLASAIILCVLSGFFPKSASAQSLTFSRVLLVDVNQQTVPAGKVWKVESILGQRTVSTNTTMHASHDILINGTVINFTNDLSVSRGTGLGVTVGASAESVSMVPFWLPPGATLAASGNVSFISVIEFTVVP